MRIDLVISVERRIAVVRYIVTAAAFITGPVARVDRRDAARVAAIECERKYRSDGCEADGAGADGRGGG